MIATPRIVATQSRKRVADKTQSARSIARDNRHAWSHAGVAVFVLTSAFLNMLANSTHAWQDGRAWATIIASAVLGVVIPCMVFILAKVAGMQYRAKARKLACFTAGVGASLLALSVYHCACALMLLTGVDGVVGWMSSLAMAITIDGGLVACELDIVLA